MVSITPIQRRRRRRGVVTTRSERAVPAGTRFGAPWERSWPHPSEPSQRPDADLDAARQHLARAWAPGDDRWSHLRHLVADFDCTRDQAEILLAERDAVQRARDAGLDPAAVREQADLLLAERTPPGAGPAPVTPPGADAPGGRRSTRPWLRTRSRWAVQGR